MKKILYTFFLLGAMLFFANASFAQAGVYTITATDSFGDGWNGAAISVTTATDGPLCLTLGGGFGPAQATFTLLEGEEVEFCEKGAGGFPNEVGVTVEDPNGVLVVDVPFGSFTGSTCFTLNEAIAPSVCADDQCQLDVTLNLSVVGNNFGGGWNGSTLEVTINGETNTPTAPIGDDPVSYTYASVCVDILGTQDIEVDFVDNSAFQDDHVAWEIVISPGFEVSDPMNLLINEGGGATNQGDGTMSGTITVTCPEPTPTPAPTVTCGIYEIGKSGFLQAPGAEAECSNGFNCTETIGGEMSAECPNATIFETGSQINLVVPGPGFGGLPNGTFPSFTVPASSNPMAVFEGIGYTICATGDFDTAGEGIEFFANGVSVGSIAGTGSQCAAETCISVSVCGANTVGETITITTTDTGNNSGFCDAQLNVTPIFNFSGEAVATDAFACISWYTSEEAISPIFIGQTLPFDVIQDLIDNGQLPASTLCHEQITTLFVTTRCGLTESDRTPVNIFSFEPCVDGCSNYLELTDAGADGWEGAKLMVSVNEGTSEEIKLTASQGACTVLQYCLSDGETLDVQYWEGADNFEHGYNVIGFDGTVLLAEGPGPSTDENRIVGSCPVVECEGETAQMTLRITLGGEPEDVSFEVYDGFTNSGCQGNLVTGVPANSFAGLPVGFVLTFPFTVDLCNQYTLNLFDGSVDGPNGATFELITTNLNYGVQITNPNDPFFGQSIISTTSAFDDPFGTKVPFTLPCMPACEDAVSTVTLGDCFADETILPIAEPVVCYPDCNHAIGCDIQFRHIILNDGNDNNVVPLNGFAPINGQTEFNYTTDALGFQMSAGCHTYVTEYLYCDGLITKCTSSYTVVPQETSSFTCNDNVIVPLRVPDTNPTNGGNPQIFFDDLGECVIQITADMVIEAGVGSPVNVNCEFFNINDFYQVVILDANDQPLVVFGGSGLPLDSNGSEIPGAANTIPANNFVSYNEIKETLKYVITHKVTGTTCWGTLTVEDKNAPTILTTGYDVNCNDPNILNEFFSETTTVQSSAAAELPANIAGGNGGSPSSAWIPFSVPCGRLGTAISDIQVSVGISHNDTPDLAIELHIPNHFNALLATPFPGGVVSLDTNGDVGGGTNIYTPNPINDSPALLGLLGAPCKGMDSHKDVTFNSETYGAELPEGHGKTWYIRVIDNVDIEGQTPVGGGEVTSASITFTCGYPFPYFAIDCALDNVELISEVLDESCSSPAVVRVWKATDACGQSSTSTQTVNILRPSISDLILPETEVNIECGTEVLNAEGEVDPSQAGSPEFCCDQVTSEDLCKLSLSYEDDILESCGNSYKVLRTWQILNWCSPTNAPTELTQLIVVGDTTGPAIDASAFTIDADANCEGSLSLADLAITDACSAVTAVRIEYTTGSTYAGTSSTNIFNLFAGDMVTGLPLGTTNATITATDECGQSTDLNVVLTVVDNNVPTAICDDQLNISLNSNGTARLFATDFDEGSNDNCSDVSVAIRSLGSVGGGFGEFADFSCADLGTVRVELEVTDAAGNTNICWADLLVEDPVGPTIECKPDVTITCDEALNAASVFTAPEATDNCGAAIEEGDIITVELPNCGQLLTQTFTATDGSDKSNDASCSQSVTIVHVSDFIVQFPADQIFTDCALEDIPEPIITEDDCENIGISTEDRIFVQVEDACYKIERTYTIINHCIVDDPSAAGFTDLGTPLPVPNTFRDDDGYFQYTQIIKVIDSEAPSITFTAPDPCDFTPECEGEAVLTATAEDACSDVAAVELSYEIDAFGDGTFDISGDGNDATGIYPYGDHIIRWIATDGCGNVTVEDFDFSVRDCKNPTPFCQGITTVVMNNGECVAIWALDLLEYAEDNCTERTTEEWDDNARIRREGSNGALTTSLDLCCEDIADGAVNIEVWIEDEAGNADFCVVAVVIQDNGGNCPTGGTGSSAIISGVTATEFDNRVDNVEVAIDNDLAMTDLDGIYASVQPINDMYTITPEKLDGVADEITTFDLVLMAQHALQINLLTTPYQLIAADVDADGDIDVFDMVELRQLILFSINNFSNNTSWRFVDAAYTFQNPLAPWSENYPQSITVMNVGNNTQEDFVAVKIGDLDGSAKRPFTNGNSAEERVTSTLTMVIEDVEMTAGNDYKVDFRASDFNDVTGYQFTLNFDQNAADFVSVEAGALNVDESNFGFTMVNEGIITTSFTDNGKATSVENDEVLFSINFSAKANATLTDVITLTNEYTLAQAYNSESEVSDVQLAFIGGIPTTTGAQFELFQNKPNPFSEFTTVGFNLPAASTATLRIYDVSGKTIKVITANYARGYNEVNVNRSDLGAAGVLYYQLDTDADSAVKKMIILE